MIIPRPYQSECVYDLIPKAFKEGHTSIIRYSPPRSGKSIEQALMTKGAYDRGNRTLILTHRSKIFSSTLKHLGNAGVPCVDFTAGNKMPVGNWLVMLAMEATLFNVIKKNPDSILPPKIIIVDEIHRNNFSKIIDFFKEMANRMGYTLFIVGFSGTPEGKHLHKYFTKIIKNVEPPDLIASGDLVPCQAYQMQDDEIDKIKKVAGEFHKGEVFKHYNQAKRYKGVLDKYHEVVKGMKGFLFCSGIEHVERTYKEFKDAGVNAFFDHSGNKQFPITNDKREYMVKGFEDSSDGVIINQGTLDTGYDHPPARFVITDFATTSITRFLQASTRASTPYPGKNISYHIDFGMNYARFGWLGINAIRPWSLDPPKKKETLGAAPMKACPNCNGLIPARANECEFCKHIFPKPTSELLEGVLCEVESGGVPLGLKGKHIASLSIEELILCQKTKKLKASYVWRTLRTMEAGDKEKGIEPVECLLSYAKAMGYKNGWLFNQRQKIQNGEIGFKNYKLT